MPPPPPGIAGAADFSSGISATSASVVSISPAIDPALTRAVLVVSPAGPDDSERRDGAQWQGSRAKSPEA
jgi:hypothetical protein